MCLYLSIDAPYSLLVIVEAYKSPPQVKLLICFRRKLRTCRFQRKNNSLTITEYFERLIAWKDKLVEQVTSESAFKDCTSAPNPVQGAGQNLRISLLCN